jgi:S1-C subfamily serine protease
MSKEQGMKIKIQIMAAIAALVFASLACQAAQPFTARATAIPTDTLAPLPAPTAASVPAISPVTNVSNQIVSQQDILTAMYQNVLPGIVAIQVVTSQGGALGTGIVYNDQGYIVTNQHVVDGQQSIEVDFNSGYKAAAKLVGADADSDLAVVKVDAPASELHPLTLGNSDQLKVGQSVVAIGNPFGLNGSMTLGIISALGRTQDSNRQLTGGGTFSVADMIQTDAAINPGNSGGPLFNMNGEVIGINRSIRTDASNVTGEPVNSGIGFAIPVNLVKRVVPALIKDGKYDYPYLGITALQSDLMSLDVINELGLKSMTGVYITGVAPGGPAEKAGVIGASQATKIQGLESGGDLVIAIDNNPVKVYDDLIGYLVDYKSPGDTVVLTVLRGDQKVDLTLTLTKRP